MSGRSLSRAARLYGRALLVLPPSIRRRDGEEMTHALDELWRASSSSLRRAAVAWTAFGSLPWVALLEWLEVVGILGPKNTGGWEMTGWGNQLRYALRTLGKAPAFTLTTIALIGLGVGAVTTIFTLVDHVLLRPLPYPAADRLVTVENGAHSGVAYRGFQELDGVETWVAGYAEDANLTGEGDPIRIQLASVSDGFFAFFGARPAVGRLLVADDFGAATSVVLAHSTWVSVFGGDPAIVGRTIRVDGEPLTVVGVLDGGFEPPQHIVPREVAAYRPIDWSNESFQRAGFHVLQVAGRLAPDIDVASVQPQLDALVERMARDYPDEMLDRAGNAMPLPIVGLQRSTVEHVRAGLGVLLGAVGLLLLVACLNVAHLFLARGIGRAQEMAVRRALGAGWGGLVQQLVTESVVVGVAGGALGLALAWLGLDVFLALSPEALPRAAEVTLDLRVAAFAVSVSLLTAVAFGAVPALRTIGVDLTGDLKGGSRATTAGKGHRRLRGGLVIAEVGLSLVLVAQAGLLLKSLARVQAMDAGFDPEGVWTIPLTPTGMDTPAEYVQAMDGVLESLESLPGVRAAGYGLTQPFEFTGNGRCCWSMGGQVEGIEKEGLRISLQPVSRGYFETLRLPVIAGTAWSAAQEAEVPTPTVVTEQLAIEVFGSADAALDHVFGRPDGMRLRIVGVAADDRHYGLDQPPPTAAYVPMSIIPFTIPLAHMAVRVEGEVPAGLARTLREAVWRVAPELPVPTVRSMDDWIADSMSGRRFDSAVFGAFGMVGLLLAAAGLYGTLLYHVRQQRRELGIRMALGAARGVVERQVVGRGMRLALTGAVLGVVGARFAGRLLESRLYDVESTDPVALGGAALVLLLTAAFASWLPARRAGRTDPLRTLTAE